MNKTRSFLAICMLFLLMGNAVAQTADTKLTFHKDGSFKIVQFTDIHWKPFYQESMQQALDNINSVLDAEKPDFVIFTGDQAYGKFPLDHSVVEKGYLQLYQPLVDRKIPFAYTTGNHDDEMWPNEKILEFLKDVPGNLTSTTPGVPGVTNYVLPIYGSQGDAAFLIYCFDSSKPSQEQVDWYVQQSLAFTEQHNKRPLPAFSFFHIPLLEMQQAIADPRARFYGTRGEEICPQGANYGLYDAFCNCGDIMGIFFGHDHQSDFAICWNKGPLMAYGRVSGGAPSSYFRSDDVNGARVFLVREGTRTFESWIRLRTGEKIQSFKYPFDFIDD